MMWSESVTSWRRSSYALLEVSLSNRLTLPFMSPLTGDFALVCLQDDVVGGGTRDPHCCQYIFLLDPLTLMFAPKIGTSCLTGQTCGSHRSDRCGQRQLNTIWTSPWDRSRQVDQDSYVERPNRSPDERDVAYTRSARQAHRSDRCA
jgi:hypothetical protein